MIGMALETRVPHPADLGMIFKILGYSLRILYMTIHADAESLNALQRLPRIEW